MCSRSDTGKPSVYIGGVIDNINGNVMNGLARLIGGSWKSIGTGVSDSKDPVVFTMALTPDLSALYVGGAFSSASSVPVNDLVVWSVSQSMFVPLAPVENWRGVVFDILPSYKEVDVASVPANNVSLSSGVILVLSAVVLCLIVVIIMIITIVIRQPPERRFLDLDDESLAINEKESWDDFYSYEWEVSYNLLEISEPAVGRGRNGVVHSAMYKGQTVAVKICK